VPDRSFLFGEWTPDAVALTGRGVQQAKNVIAMRDGYRPLPSAAITSNALGVPKGAFSFRDRGGAAHQFCGIDTKIYESIGGTWVERGSVPGSTEQQWMFAQYGDRVLACNGATQIQSALPGNDFAAVPNSPIATDLAVVRNYVVASTHDELALRWSGNNNFEDWTPGVDTDADGQPFPEGGRIKAIRGGEFGIIFQDNAVTRQTFIGGDLIFQFDQIEGGAGTLAGSSVVGLQDVTFYASHNGFYVFDGVRSQPIGAEKVDRYFLRNVNKDALNRISAAVDTENKLVIWSYPTSSETPDRLLIYNWIDGRWSEGEFDHGLIYSALSDYTSLDDLPGELDTVSPALDSEAYLGGIPSVGVFSASGASGTLSGTPLPASVTSQELEPSPAYAAHLREARILTDADNHSLTIHHRRNQNADTVPYGPVTPRDSGRCALRVKNRYYSAQVDIPAQTWTYLIGLNARIEKSGRR
jgi:hypothetical protein